MAQPMQTSEAEPSPDSGGSPSRGGESPRYKAQEELADIVGAKENRKVRARSETYKSVWFGFGMFGIVGWSVAIPAVVFIAIGVWIDKTWPSPYSWTLMMLFIGIVIGCLNAWHWISRERDKLDR